MMNDVNIPKVTEQYRHIIENPPRYLGYKGGRGGGKSESIARALLIIARSKKVKIVCAREVMESIADSVYGLLARLIKEYGLNDYRVLRSEIRNLVTGSVFLFKGFFSSKQDNSFKSIDDIDIFWGEEAHCFRWESIKLLRPSVRAKGSILIFSWNPFSMDDAIEKLFRTPGLDCKLFEVNFLDNPFLPDVLKEELKADYRAMKAKILPEEQYNQIWWGLPIGEYEESLCKFADVQYCMSRSYDAVTGDEQIGVDVARFGNDKSVITRRKGMKVMDIREFARIPGNWLVKEIEAVAAGRDNILISVDATGASSIGDFINSTKYQVENVNFGQRAHKSVNSKEYVEAIARGERPSGMWFTIAKHEMAYHMASLIKKRIADLPEHEGLRRQLTRIKVKYQKATGGFVWAIEGKEEYKKREGESTDYADSLFLAFYPKFKFKPW